LDGLKSIKVCTGYEGVGEKTSASLMDVDLFKNLQPVYEELPGWEESTCGVKSLDDLPTNAQAYIQYIERIVEVPVDIISTGPDREETIIRRHPFSA